MRRGRLQVKLVASVSASTPVDRVRARVKMTLLLTRPIVAGLVRCPWQSLQKHTIWGIAVRIAPFTCCGEFWGYGIAALVDIIVAVPFSNRSIVD